MERLSIAGVTLDGVAQGGWQTAIHIPEARAIFDAGMMLPVSTDHIFITHGHPDHIGALPAIVARRAIKDTGKPLSIHVPAGIADEVRTALEAMDRVFGDRTERPWRLFGREHGDVVPTGQGAAVRALRTFHGVASCGWAVEKTVRKLKAEFVGRSGPEIMALREQGVVITDEVTNTVAVIPGDTTIEFLLREERARTAKVLLHEVTFWDDRSSVEGCRRFGHTHVDEMIEHCDKFEGDALVLVHRSLKHKRAEVEEILHKRFPAAMLPKIHLFDGGDR
jgi:ribonuclease Z